MDNERLTQIVRSYDYIDNNISLLKINASNNVYKITIGSVDKYILKEYFRKDNFYKDLISLKLFGKHKIKVAKLIDHSTENSGEMWILYRYIVGYRLEDLDLVKVHEKNKLFFQIGVEVSKIHKLIKLNIYKDKNMNVFRQKSIKYFTDAVKFYYTSLISKYPDYASLFEKAYDFINEYTGLYNSKINFAMIVGDLNSKNIIINNSMEELEGFIDFEFMSYGNVYCDFVTFMKYFREDLEILKSFMRGYTFFNRKFKYNDAFMKVKLLFDLLNDCNLPQDENLLRSNFEEMKSILS